MNQIYIHNENKVSGREFPISRPVDLASLKVAVAAGVESEGAGVKATRRSPIFGGVFKG